MTEAGMAWRKSAAARGLASIGGGNNGPSRVSRPNENIGRRSERAWRLAPQWQRAHAGHAEK